MFFCIIDQPGDVKKKACKKLAVSHSRLKRRHSSTRSMADCEKLSTIGIRNEEVHASIMILYCHHNTCCFRKEIYYGIKFQLILMLKNIKILNSTVVQSCTQCIDRKGCQLISVYNGYSILYPSTKFCTLQLTPAKLELLILNIGVCSQVGLCRACILTRCVYSSALVQHHPQA